MSATLLAVVLLAGSAHAQFRTKFIGEGRGSNPNPESTNALETASGGPTHMAIIQRVAPPKQKDPEEKDLTPEPNRGRVGGSGAGAATLTSREFDGAAERPELREPAGSGRAALPEDAAPAPAPAAPRPGEVFVAVDVTLTGRPDRDAVADLARVAAFRPDGRFPPQARGKDQVWLWGWMPPARIADAFSVRGVSRVQMDPPARRAAFEGARGAVTVSLRLPPGQEARAAVAVLEREVAGLKTSGEPRVDGGVASVEAEVPLRELTRLMAQPGVLRVEPAQRREPILATPLAAPEGGFLKFAAGRAPVLLIVTLLLLLPPVARGVVRLAEIFIPYQK